jgi:hypothetical protein
MSLFISFPSSSHASCFLILLQCIGCFGSHVISFLLQSSINSITLSWVHYIITVTKTLKKPQITTDSHHSSRQKHREWKEGEMCWRWWRVTLHAQTCSGLNRVILLMRRPNTDSAPNKPVRLPHHKLSIRYVVTRPVHTATMPCYGGNVTSVYKALKARRKSWSGLGVARKWCCSFLRNIRYCVWLAVLYHSAMLS